MHQTAVEFSENQTGQGGVQNAEDRRREPRFAVTGPCYVAWSDYRGETCCGATIQDMSRNGLRISTRAKAIPGATIHVYIGEREVVIGEVRHCTDNGDGSCDIGILIRTLSGERKNLP